MMASILLLFIGVISGTLLTFVYGPKMHFAARRCAGTATGLAILATVGFIAASIFGLNRTSLFMAAGITALPILILLSPEYRTRITSEFALIVEKIKHPSASGAAYLLFYLAVAVFLGFLFDRAAFSRPDGIYTGVVNALGDLPFHLQVISSFAYGQNFPPEDPFFSGVRFAYPFLADFLTAMFVRAGASAIFAMWMQSMALGLALAGMVHYWTVKLTKDRLAGFIAPILVLLGGGLGWWLLFQDVRGGDMGLLALLRHLPHDYTIMGDTIWRWGNSLTTLLIPQRSMLFGLPVAVVIFSQWWAALVETPDSGSSKRMMAAGVFAGMLPLLHSHTFIVVMGMAACLALLFPHWRAWLTFFVPALFIAVPEMIWCLHGTGINALTFLGWAPGWDKGSHNAIWFWFVNTGAFIPLLIAAIVWREKERDLVPPRALRFYLPFLLCFIVPNLVKFAPWVWDNIKILFYWYVASVPFVALILAAWIKDKKWSWAAAGLLVALTLAGTLDNARILTRTTEYREFDQDGIAMAGEILRLTEPRATVLHAPVYNSPVFLTGRRSLLGYPGNIWSRGLDYGQREKDIHSIFAGEPQALSLMQSYRVNYVLISPMERNSLKVNDLFWSQFPSVAQSGEYRLYKIAP